MGLATFAVSMGVLKVGLCSVQFPQTNWLRSPQAVLQLKLLAKSLVAFVFGALGFVGEVWGGDLERSRERGFWNGVPRTDRRRLDDQGAPGVGLQTTSRSHKLESSRHL